MNIRTLIKNILLIINPTYRVANSNRTYLGEIKSSLIQMNDDIKKYISKELEKIPPPHHYKYMMMTKNICMQMFRL